ncbi:MAG: PleD family two-component system response regulator [Planctomycetaceae bacterium]
MTAGALKNASTRVKKRVLVADDDSGILETIRAALVGRGYDVVTAHDGAEALMCAERDAPDLIVLDMVMPRRSGLSVIDRLHSNKARKATPIIVVSGQNDERQLEYMNERGVVEYLHKPFDIDQLLKRIDAILPALD